MSKPPAQDNAEDSEDDSVECDLQTLKEMNIDRDFNVWSDFRNSFSVATRQNLRRLSASVNSRHTTGGAIGSSVSSAEMGSISESDIGVGEDQEHSLLAQSAFTDDGSCSSLMVKFSPLSPAERREIRASAVRLERLQIFSRYYFPEAWELREKEAIQKELMLTEPLVSGAKADEPNEVTVNTINSIFFPGDHDPKSVLLKRGPTLFDGVDERELILFTHGFMVSRIEFDNLVKLLFDMDSVKFISKEDADAQMHQRFDALDTDCTGELDRCELREVFLSMGVPIGEQMLSELMDRFDVDQSGTIDFQEFKQVLIELCPKKEPEPKNLFGALKKRFIGGLSQSDLKRKLDIAFPLSDIDRVESLHICYSAKTEMFAKSSWAEISFAVFIRFRKHPLIFVCSKPEQRGAWVDAFKVCLINSMTLGGNNFQRDGKPGWQHKLIRESLYSMVVCDDNDGINRFIQDPPPETSINDPDEYYGYTALHYAVVLNRFHCAALLLANGAKANRQDHELRTPLDHATDKKMIDLLKHYGGKKNPAYAHMMKDQKSKEEAMKSSDCTSKANNTTHQKVDGATGVMAETMSAMRERGERLENLDSATASLSNDAADYADMAKQLKEKAKKKSMFGMKN